MGSLCSVSSAHRARFYVLAEILSSSYLGCGLWCFIVATWLLACIGAISCRYITLPCVDRGLNQAGQDACVGCPFPVDFFPPKQSPKQPLPEALLLISSSSCRRRISILALTSSVNQRSSWYNPINLIRFVGSRSVKSIVDGMRSLAMLTVCSGVIY